MLALLAAWLAWSCVASLSGGSYVSETHDCLSPALLSLAATAALCCGRRAWQQQRQRRSRRRSSGRCEAATLLAPAAVALRPAVQHHCHGTWLLALGMLQFLATALTLASFGLTSIPFTFSIRALEPLFSATLMWVLHRRRSSVQELLLLAAVIVSTCVAVGSSSGGQGLSSSPAAAAASAAQQAGSGAPLAAAALALVATATVSCRSVASKTVAALAGTSEVDDFLASATPGLAAAGVLHAALWALFGLRPLQGLAAAGWAWRPASTLLACALCHCGYNAASFMVLARSSPVLHGVLNITKRVAIIVVAALAFGQPLTPLQLLGVLAANAAAVVLVLQQSAAASGRVLLPACSSPRSSLPGDASWHGQAALPRPARVSHAAAAAATAAGSEKACGSSCRMAHHRLGPSSADAVAPHQHHPPHRLLSRLAWVIATVVICAAVCLAYVLAALAQPPYHHHHHQPPQQQQQQHVSQIQPLPSLLSGAGATRPQRPSWQLRIQTGNANRTSSSISYLSQDGVAAAAAAEHTSIEAAAELFALRDIQRARCLTDLHNAAKASLAPFLQQGNSSIALFDVALHKNLGDALLWAAAARLVPEFHTSVKYVCALSQFPGDRAGGPDARRVFPSCDVRAMLRALGPRGVVLLPPGGNWGDLWWFVHSQRLGYLQQMGAAVRAGEPLFQVVQLPQSISFSAPARAQRDRQVVNGLPRGMLTLFARQADSLAYARRHYPNASVLTGPDLAFSLGPLMASSKPPVVDILFLMRQDKEAAASEGAAAAGAAAASASASGPGSKSGPAGAPQAKGRRGLAAAAARRSAEGGASDDADADSRAEAAEALQQLAALQVSYEMREWDFGHANFSREVSRVALTQVAESRLAGAVDIISHGKVVVTNRLHAAVLANLIGRPLVWIDTQQRKLSGVRSLAFSHSPACTEANLHSQQAGSFPEAVAAAVERLRAPGFVWSALQLQLTQPADEPQVRPADVPPDQGAAVDAVV